MSLVSACVSGDFCPPLFPFSIFGGILVFNCVWSSVFIRSSIFISSSGFTVDVFSVFRVESEFNRECFLVFLSSGDSDRSRFTGMNGISQCTCSCRPVWNEQIYWPTKHVVYVENYVYKYNTRHGITVFNRWDDQNFSSPQVKCGQAWRLSCVRFTANQYTDERYYSWFT